MYTCSKSSIYLSITERSLSHPCYHQVSFRRDRQLKCTRVPLNHPCITYHLIYTCFKSSIYLPITEQSLSHPCYHQVSFHPSSPFPSCSPCHPDQGLASRHPVIAPRLCRDAPLDPRWESHTRVTLIKSYEDCGEGELALWRRLAVRRSARLILLTRPLPSWLARARQRV